MKLFKISAKAIVLIVLLALRITVFSQTAFHANGVTVSLTGTSTLHDWEMKGAQGNSDAAFTIDAKGVITALNKLSFSMPANSIKSEHTLMDNNTYKALNTEKYANITFTLSAATVTALGNNSYQLSCMGKLTIAGTVKETDLVATCKYNPADQSITVTGIKKFKMTDYNVKPPTVMMGTIKTGNDIAIAYNVHFVK